MNRLDRRIRLLRGRRTQAFDPGQLAIEAAPRERAARLVRGALQTGRPVIVRHARWSAVKWWLDDIRIDLALAERPMEAHVLDLSLGSLTGSGWERLPSVVGRVLGTGGPVRAGMPTSREAFRSQLSLVLRKARSRRMPKVLMCVNADGLGYERLQDLCDAFTEARSQMTPGTEPGLVVTSRIGGQSLRLEHSMDFFLPDPTRSEAIRMAAELLGETDPDVLHAYVDAIGPVPDFLRLGARAGGSTDPMELREALGATMRELAEAVDIVSARRELADRLEALATGPQPFERELDWALMRAGLVVVDAKAGLRGARLRSPLIRSLVTFED